MAKLKMMKKFKWLWITIICLLLAGIILFVSIIFSFRGKIFPNTYVAGIYVGDMTTDQATTILKSSIQTPQDIQLISSDNIFQIDAKEVGLGINYNDTSFRAFVYSNSGNIFKDALTKSQLIFKPINLSLKIDHDPNKLKESISITTSKLGEEPVMPEVTVSQGVITVNNGKNGIRPDLDKTYNNLLEKLSVNNTSPSEIYLENYDVELSQEEADIQHNRANILLKKNIELIHPDATIVLANNDLLNLFDYGNNFDKQKILTYVQTVSKKINRDAQNSVFVVDNGSVKEFVPSKDGLVVKEENLAELIYSALTTLETTKETKVSINIPVNTSPAKIKTEDVNNLGINVLLGKGVSYFRGSIPNRVYNVNLAASKFKGILIAPNETFSFNNVLGDVSGLTGYKAAYVIKDGRTVLGDGGGVCQVSTTLFRAILNAGLPVVERRAHSYRVGYYEQGFPVGLDATVYYPTTDLKFVNNSPAHLLIQSVIDIPSSTLVFEIYGTNDGRVATTSKPIITSSSNPPDDLYIDDPTLPTGKINQVEHKAWGARVVFDYKVERNGEILTEKTFVSSYRPWGAVFMRGTGPATQ